MLRIRWTQLLSTAVFLLLSALFLTTLVSYARAQSCGGYVNCREPMTEYRCSNNGATCTTSDDCPGAGTCKAFGSWDYYSIRCNDSTYGTSCGGFACYPGHDTYSKSCYTYTPPAPPAPQPLKYGCSGTECTLQTNGPYSSSTCGGACNPTTTYGCVNGSCAPGGTGFTTSTCNNSCGSNDDDDNTGGNGCYDEHDCGDITQNDCCNGQCVPEGTACGGGGCAPDTDWHVDETAMIRFISNEGGVMTAWKGTANPASNAGDGAATGGQYEWNSSADPASLSSERNREDAQMNVRLQVVGKGDVPDDPYFSTGRLEIIPPTGIGGHQPFGPEVADDKTALANYGWWGTTSSGNSMSIVEPMSGWTNLTDENGTVVGWNILVRQLDKTYNVYNCASYTSDNPSLNPCIREASIVITTPYGTVSGLQPWEAYSFRMNRGSCDGEIKISQAYLWRMRAWWDAWWGGFPNGSSQWRDFVEKHLSSARNNNPSSWDPTAWNNAMTSEGYWSLTYSYHSTRMGVKYIPKVVVTPPTGYTCAPKAWKYNDAGRKYELNVNITPNKNCEVSDIGGGLTFVEFVKDTTQFISMCNVNIDSRSELMVNTNNLVAPADRPAGQVVLEGLSNDPAGAPDQGTASLLFERVTYSGANTNYAQPFPTPPTSISLPNGFVGSSTNQFQTNFWPSANPSSYYWRWRSKIQSLNGTLEQLLGPKFEVSKSFFNTASGNTTTRMPAGDYYLFCEMPFGTNGFCSGNPYCDHEGGTHTCEGFASCSEPSIGQIAQFAVQWNQVKYRMIPLNNDGTVKSYTKWSDGPFTFKALNSTHWWVKSIAAYATKNNTYLYTWQQRGGNNPAQWDSRLVYWIIPHRNGFPDWSVVTNNPNGSTVPSYGSLPSGVTSMDVRAHSIRFNGRTKYGINDSLPDTHVIEYLYAYNNSTQRTQGYYRVTPLQPNGAPNFASAGGWQNSNLGTGAWSVNVFGNTLVPINENPPAASVSGPSRLYQSYAKETFSSTDDSNQWQRLVLIGQNSSSTTFDPNAGFVPIIFGRNIVPDAYDEVYLPNGISDKVKLTVACVPRCGISDDLGVCTPTAVGDDGCGGTCPATQVAITPTSMGTISVTPAKFEQNTDSISVSWDRSANASGYELIVYPIESTTPPTTSADIQAEVDQKYQTKDYPGTLTLFQFVSQQSGARITQTVSGILSRKETSPKLRVAVRALNTCSTATSSTVGQWQVAQVPSTNPGNAPTQSVSVLSDLTFRLAEVQVSANCSAATPSQVTFSRAHVFRMTNTLTSPSIFAQFPTAASNTRTLNVGSGPFPTAISLTQDFTFQNVWHSPHDNYNISPNSASDLLTYDDYQQVCANTSASGLDAPEVPTPIVYLRKAYDPWWQARGSSVRAAGFGGGSTNLVSLIPTNCATLANCYPAIITNLIPNVDNKTSGIPIARNTITNRKTSTVNGQLYSQHGSNAQAHTVGETQNSYLVSDLQRDVQDMIDGATAVGSSANLTLAGLPSPGNATAYDWPRDSASPTRFYVRNITAPTTTITFPTGGWILTPTQRVIILVNGDLVLRGTGTALSAATTVQSGGFLLIAATGNITIENSIGRAPSAGMNSTNPGHSLQGIFLAGGTLTIAGTGGDAVADNQFIGLGSFIGLGGVELARDFMGQIGGTGDDLRYLNNANPTEIFKFDPSLVRNTPLFIRQSVLTYKEVE